MFYLAHSLISIFFIIITSVLGIQFYCNEIFGKKKLSIEQDDEKNIKKKLQKSVEGFIEHGYLSEDETFHDGNFCRYKWYSLNKFRQCIPTLQF